MGQGDLNYNTGNAPQTNSSMVDSISRKAENFEIYNNYKQYAMSIIKHNLVFILTLCFAYAQESKNQKVTIFVDFNDQKMWKYSINNDDNIFVSFVIYIEKYQTKEVRDKATTTYYNDQLDKK
jgi:hypothetical protein